MISWDKGCPHQLILHLLWVIEHVSCIYSNCNDTCVAFESYRLDVVRSTGTNTKSERGSGQTWVRILPLGTVPRKKLSASK